MSEAHRVTTALSGKWYGRYGVARCPAHADTHPSLTIADGPTGLLLLHCKAGCNFADVLAALRWKGIVEGEGQMPEPNPAELARAQAKAERDAVKKEWHALALWNKAQAIAGTPAETYLRGRAITCYLPDSLRFHPSCRHPEAGHLPALVARVEGSARFAIHRTYLRPDGRAKAEVQPSKAMLGTTAGGAVPVAFAENGPLVVAEGIETALSLASGLVDGPATVWAALSTSGMGGLGLPSGKPHRLIVGTDGDAPGRGAGFKLAERARAEGWEVSLLSAPEGRDWNDVLMLAAVKKGGEAC